jgi:transcriptional regulator with XRE-family HTH domain
MNTTKRDQIWESLQNPQFRSQFVNEYMNVGIAFQIHGLRERQGLKQKQLAERLGDKKKQPLVSAWENPNYGKYTLKTLKDLANAFDVGLLVRFVPFSKLIDWTINLTHDVIAPPSFSEEQSYSMLSSQLSAIIDDIDKNKGIDANTSYTNKPGKTFTADSV